MGTAADRSRHRTANERKSRATYARLRPAALVLPARACGVIIDRFGMMEWTLAQGRALVIGGSVGGLFAAHLLRGAGWDVAVFERAAGDLGDRGTGIGTREELFAVMRRIGLAADASLGVEVRGRIGLARDGAVIHERPCAPSPAPGRASGARCGRPCRTPAIARWQGADAGSTGRRAGHRDLCRWLARRGRPADRRRRLHSTVRAQLLPDSRHATPAMWPGAAWSRSTAFARAARYAVPPYGVRFSGRRIDAVDPDAGAGGAPGKRPAISSGSGRWLEIACRLCTDASGRRHGVSIPPPLIRA